MRTILNSVPLEIAWIGKGKGFDVAVKRARNGGRLRKSSKRGSTSGTGPGRPAGGEAADSAL